MKNIYTLKNLAEKEIAKAYSTEKAIYEAKIAAALHKTSIFVYKNGTYYGVAEFPIYLRNLEFTPKEIHFYRL